MYLLLKQKLNIKKLLKFLFFMCIAFFTIVDLSYSTNQKNLESYFKKGIYIYKKANCSSCHLWHADGGNSHGGAAASLRNTNLSYQELFRVIKCGRSGTNMPYFLRYAKKDIDCINIKDNSLNSKETFALKGSKMLNESEIVTLSKFIHRDIKNKPITKKYCLAFFRREEVCNNYTN